MSIADEIARIAKMARLTSSKESALSSDHLDEIDEIADYVRELEQRAEAAEALNNHLELAVRKAEGVSEAMRRKVEAAEAKLAELAKQKPVAYVMGEETIEDFNSGYEFFAVREAEHEEEMKSLPLYARPTPPAPFVVKLPRRLSPEVADINDAYMAVDAKGEYLDRDDVIEAIKSAGGGVLE